MNDSENVFAVILAGGQSNRLFPFNKVLSDLTGQGRSLIQQSYDRLVKSSANVRPSPLVSPGQTFILTTAPMVLPIRAQLPLPTAHIFVDPARRGTWPAILWAMAHLRMKNPEAVLAIVTADHIIPDVRAFRLGVAAAIHQAATEPAVVLLGVKPTPKPSDWLGFGCFKMGRLPGNAKAGVRRLIGFDEKPALEKASMMISERAWVWNAGMFFFRISLAERALTLFHPEMSKTYQSVVAALSKGDMIKAKKIYQDFPLQIQHPSDPNRMVDNTIDYAMIPHWLRQPGDHGVLYGLSNALPRWADVGEWVALRGLLKPDRRENVRLGRVILDAKTRRCIVSADQGLAISVKGLEDAVVAFSQNTAFIFALDPARGVKEVVAGFRQRSNEKVILSESDCRVLCKGGRVVVHGLSGLNVKLVKNQLSVVGRQGVL